VWWGDRVIIAMAGNHQLWELHLAADPEAATVAVLAGTTQEGLRDGAAAEGWLAQPSGLAASADGSRVWVADAETSALRSISGGRTGFELRTHVGAGLFDFGHRDGAADQALLQHPLGVTELSDGSVAVCDTFNGAIRRFDPATGLVTTLATGLSEPSDAVVEHVAPVGGEQGGMPDGEDRGEGGDEGHGETRLLVVESGAHRVVRIALPVEAQRVDGPARRTQRPSTQLSPGRVELEVTFTPPKGRSSTTGGATPPAWWCLRARRTCSSKEPGRRRA